VTSHFRPTAFTRPAPLGQSPSGDDPVGSVGAPDIDGRVALDLTTLLFTLTPRPMFAGAAFSVLVGAVLWPTLAGPVLLGWVVVRVLISALRIWDCRNFNRQDPGTIDYAARWRRFMVLMVCESASWSAMGLLFTQVASPQTGLVLLAGLVAVSAVSVFSLGSDFRASGLFVSIILLPNALQQLLHRTPDTLIAGVGMLVLLSILLLEGVGLQRRIGELARLRHENAAIAEQRRRALFVAEHSSRAKSQFLATVSHEMRTPLNGILGMTQLLQHTTSDPLQRSKLEVIAQSGRHLQKVIGDLLDLSRIESGRLVIDPRVVRTTDTVREVADLLQPLAAQKGLRFEVQLADDLPPWIVADGSRVKQVLHNLLGNAIKFTLRGVVDLSAAREGDRIHFCVRDTGPGIPPDQIERIFSAFEQVVLPNTAHFRTGTGLGLTISRDLARAMGGDVRCESIPGQGSAFHFDMPFRACAGPQDAGEDVVDEDLQRLSGRILVADDNPVNAMIAKAMLELLGLEVTMAEDGHAALDQLSQSSFAAVLMDCQMPGLDGWKATRRWREQERSSGARRTPIIALTANAVVGDRERCIEAGMDDYLPKPFELRELSSVMRRYLSA